MSQLSGYLGLGKGKKITIKGIISKDKGSRKKAEVSAVVIKVRADFLQRRWHFSVKEEIFGQ